MKKIFLSGPIAGRINLNKGVFNDAAHILRALGYVAINPHELSLRHDTTDWDEPQYYKLCCSELCLCDGMVQLDGHATSKGAAIEKSLCDLLKIPYQTIDKFLEDNGHV
jgi:hypothetical protein